MLGAGARLPVRRIRVARFGKSAQASTGADIPTIGVTSEADNPYDALHHTMAQGAGASNRGPRGMAGGRIAPPASSPQRRQRARRHARKVT